MAEEETFSLSFSLKKWFKRLKTFTKSPQHPKKFFLPNSNICKKIKILKGRRAGIDLKKSSKKLKSKAFKKRDPKGRSP
ncbi:hypothetical protein AA80_06325 [Petrotoga sibirica DSM 13575]|uniref:Uncharacterized protein n=1 Tax=Petrotoga sibirica DSM 13575 TaxID=1122956 RepID=A0A855MN49_9BACT|nr:hypothetical protein AA80_06325 [Petrotoga sibirica DSM 13575]